MAVVFFYLLARRLAGAAVALVASLIMVVAVPLVLSLPGGADVHDGIGSYAGEFLSFGAMDS